MSLATEHLIEAIGYTWVSLTLLLITALVIYSTVQAWIKVL